MSQALVNAATSNYLREKAAAHPIESVGKDLRSLFAWKQQDEDYVEGSAAR